jgi:hypothetical protein
MPKEKRRDLNPADAQRKKDRKKEVKKVSWPEIAVLPWIAARVAVKTALNWSPSFLHCARSEQGHPPRQPRAGHQEEDARADPGRDQQAGSSWWAFQLFRCLLHLRLLVAAKPGKEDEKSVHRKKLLLQAKQEAVDREKVFSGRWAEPDLTSDLSAFRKRSQQIKRRRSLKSRSKGMPGTPLFGRLLKRVFVCSFNRIFGGVSGCALLAARIIWRRFLRL